MTDAVSNGTWTNSPKATGALPIATGCVTVAPPGILLADCSALPNVVVPCVSASALPVAEEIKDDDAACEGGVKQFAFPEVTAEDRPLAGAAVLKAAWPKCDCTETKLACAKLAETLVARLRGNRASILAMTSSCDCDNAVELVAALAPELARACGGLLVVDADFHQADLTAQLSLPFDETGEAAPICYSTEFSGLSVVPMQAGVQERQTLDAKWIAGLRDHWRLTLLNLASMQHPETAPLLNLCDASCLAVRIGHTSRRAITKAVAAMECCSAKFFGCIAIGDGAAGGGD